MSYDFDPDELERVAQKINNHDTTSVGTTRIEMDTGTDHDLEWIVKSRGRNPITVFGLTLVDSRIATWTEIHVNDRVMWDHLPTLDLDHDEIGPEDVLGYASAALKTYDSDPWSLLGWLGLE